MFSASVTVVAHAASLTAARGRSCPRVSATCTEVANAARSNLREAGEVEWTLLWSRG
ncbi:hypothetical protein PF002_g32432 [Phytophthora fragariae]|uniref:Uncharacterized protein n=1 Tax=Phytophthora fragariae TaxID=53985 RepID=A0A6A3V7X0_9STRA|nr:hypothetical protein PF002_g32432 [Phytophthora fragariae]